VVVAEAPQPVADARRPAARGPKTDEAVRTMLRAWVLIQTEVGRAGEVAAAVAAIDGVETAEVTAGPFDVIAKVQARSLDALGRLIVSRVQAVPGTMRTLTCPRPGK
jgi:DNA-binding Lrp family transcriptional regulator